MHVTAELTRALRDDEIPQSLGELLLANHLAQADPDYERALLATRQRVVDSYLNRLLDLWCDEGTCQDQVDVAREHLDLLQAVPVHDERLGKVRRAYARFSSPALVALLLAEARAVVSSAPQAAFESAELALAVAEKGNAPNTAVALAAAHAGNARRAAGELTDASPYFDRTYDVLNGTAEPEPWILAEAASLEGSLLKDSRRFDAAHKSLACARHYFAVAGDPSGAARVQIKQAEVYYLSGRLERAVEVLGEALQQIRGLTEPKLLVLAVHNLVLYLTESGHTATARTVLHFLRATYDWYPEFKTRHIWLQGRVELKDKSYDAAEGCFRIALDRFVTTGSSFYSALVALDLAEIFIVIGRVDQVVKVTRPLPPLFRRQGIDREATAAVVLFHKAARQGKISRRLLSELRTFLEIFGRDRSVRFQPSRKVI